MISLFRVLRAILPAGGLAGLAALPQPPPVGRFILLGLPDTTQDADLFVDRSPENGLALADALRDLGFELTEQQRGDLQGGKDFIQLKNGPFDVDVVYAPDGIECFADAWQRHVEVEGFHVCHIDDIIASKESANRVRDRESLPRLRAFREGSAARGPDT